MCPMCFLVIYRSFGYPAYKYANDLKPKCLNHPSLTMDGSEDDKEKMPQLLIRNSGRMVPIMRYSRVVDIS